MKILNLYSGLGGNRFYWKNHEITSVDFDSDIMKVYKLRFPNDKTYIMDCITFIENFDLSKFDFIWLSPDCKTHSRLNNSHSFKYVPNLTEIYGTYIFLMKYYKGLFCIENTISYYKPLITPILLGRHYFWSNFNIPIKKLYNNLHDYSTLKINDLCKLHNIDKSLLDLIPWKKYKTNDFKNQVLRNCVEKEISEYIINIVEKIIYAKI